VVTSPLTRTLQTTLLAYGLTISRLGGKSKIVCLPEAQECNDFPCDTGRSKLELLQNPAFRDLNFERLTDDWTSKRGFYSADRGAIRKRAQWVRQFLRDRSEKEIVVVAHGDVLRQITATRDGPGTYMWRNAEMRVFTFDPETVDGEECFLQLEEIVEATGGYGHTSSELDIPSAPAMANGAIANGKI
jgi:broad specificity phosphatase PhoE